MPSLKEIRNRIKSVSSTRKITNAMKMVSAAKLKKAQRAIENSLPYVSKLSSIVETFISSLGEEQKLELTEVRKVKRVAIIAVSSNSSLCGIFNSNIQKAFNEIYKKYSSNLDKDDILVYPIGKKIAEAIRIAGIKAEEVNIDIGNMNYAGAAALARQLMDDFAEKNIDKVEFIHNHFKSASVQQVWINALLPFGTSKINENGIEDMNKVMDYNDEQIGYIVEPSKEELINELLPKMVSLRFFCGLQDSIAAEHAARTTTMQIATENADDLLQELRLTYNKMRQSAITTEIITITGGAEAIKH